MGLDRRRQRNFGGILVLSIEARVEREEIQILFQWNVQAAIDHGVNPDGVKLNNRAVDGRMGQNEGDLEHIYRWFCPNGSASKYSYVAGLR